MLGRFRWRGIDVGVSSRRWVQHQHRGVGNILDGKLVAEELRAKLKKEVETIRAKHENFKPKLLIIQVGNRSDSTVYIKAKTTAAKQIGIEAEAVNLPTSTTQNDLLHAIKHYNQDNDVHGIIVQLPFDSHSHIDERTIMNTISIHKDVDGFHSYNVGELAKKGAPPPLVSCTPKACISILDHYQIPIAGQHAVVLGRSDIVGRPMSYMLLNRDATVTICHSKTKNLKSIVQLADILIVAIGQAELVKADWIKPRSIVLDCGINLVPDPSKSKGHRICGDVAYNEIKEIAGFITPVPGGIGPLTVTMLLQNTILSAKYFYKV